MSDLSDLSNSLQKRLLIIGYVWPEPNSSAAGTRMMQLIQLFASQNWNITFASPAKLGEHKVDLQTLGIAEKNIELNDSSFDNFITQLQPNMVIFDRFMMEEQFGWRVAKYAPQALRILNTEDLHSLRASRQKLLKQFLKNQPNNIDLEDIALTDSLTLFTEMALSDIAKREIAAIYRSDLTLMISAFEMQLLTQQFSIPQQQLFYLPFVYQPLQSSNSNSATINNWQERQHFISIGNFRHEPNWDAVLWLKQEIWPLIRKQLPSAELHIYGAYPPPKATALHNKKQGFLIKGWAEDALDVMQQARVCLAPLRFGAGIKGKLADAMQTGTPSVTTDIGAESMLNTHLEQWPGAIANNAEDYANAAVELYQNNQACSDCQTLALKNFQLNYEDQSFNDKLMHCLQLLTENLTRHRSQNFTGSMLNHHHHKSTQYMAQWIEAKNKIEVSETVSSPNQNSEIIEK